MIDHFAIRSAFRTQLATATNYPGDDRCAWENREFTPPETGLWIEEDYLPGTEDLSANRRYRLVGVMQYSLYIGTDEGTKTIEALADDIKDAFAPADSFSELVHVTRCERKRGRRSGAWYMIPIDIGFTAFAIKQ